ncbi:hypothetical protein EON67_02850, partial [archaeon]
MLSVIVGCVPCAAAVHAAAGVGGARGGWRNQAMGGRPSAPASTAPAGAQKPTSRSMVDATTRQSCVTYAALMLR